MLLKKQRDLPGQMHPKSETSKVRFDDTIIQSTVEKGKGKQSGGPSHPGSQDSVVVRF